MRKLQGLAVWEASRLSKNSMMQSLMVNILSRLRGKLNLQFSWVFLLDIPTFQLQVRICSMVQDLLWISSEFGNALSHWSQTSLDLIHSNTKSLPLATKYECRLQHTHSDSLPESRDDFNSGTWEVTQISATCQLGPRKSRGNFCDNCTEGLAIQLWTRCRSSRWGLEFLAVPCDTGVFHRLWS